MTSKHEINGQEITIDWEQIEEMENHDSQCSYWAMIGYGSDSKDYEGTGIFVHGECDEVIDVMLREAE